MEKLSIVSSPAATVEENDEQNLPFNVFNLPVEVLINVLKYLKMIEITRFDSVSRLINIFIKIISEFKIFLMIVLFTGNKKKIISSSLDPSLFLYKIR